MLSTKQEIIFASMIGKIISKNFAWRLVMFCNIPDIL